MFSSVGSVTFLPFSEIREVTLSNIHNTRIFLFESEVHPCIVFVHLAVRTEVSVMDLLLFLVTRCKAVDLLLVLFAGMLELFASSSQVFDQLFFLVLKGQCVEYIE